ncbi:hypothetical protein F2P56_027406 [Juglans regia]|uniref:Uncharacterized protein LOC109005938 isoform X2 n=2 Tax=Juglans regia TaxID=51240 RepID=A0A2I4G9L5_JUGRE|nr:uncharacterized protein LOC109005938 isoform X2 [Juglans regia]KAF5452405.1 hypothetical protein F2P56_027406 [Juglans regia]
MIFSELNDSEMVSLGKNDGEIKPIKTEPNINTPDIQTQVLDSQFSPPSFSDEKFEAEDADELKYLRSTLSFDDTVPIEDAFETQEVNLAGETQVLNIGGETQVLDDPDCIEDMGTQILDDFDTQVASDIEGEGTEETEVLGNDDEQSDDESVRSGNGQSVDSEKIYTSLHDNSNKGFVERLDPLPYKEHSAETHLPTATHVVEGSHKPKAGPLRSGFTSVRVASLRASALEIHTALEGINKGSFYVSSKNRSWEVGEEVAQDHDVGQCYRKIKGLNDEKMYRVGSRTARKLFTEDSHDDYRGLPHNSNDVEREGLPQLPSCDDGLAGLSYVDSQEPAEFSQANALDFVDRFLKDNFRDFEQADHRKKTKGKSNSVPIARGPQSFAKKANDRNMLEEAGIFDWDDSREDEGGGDIFCRMKEKFFDTGGQGRRSFTQPRKPKGSGLDDYRGHEEHLDFSNKRMGLAHSDSKLISQRPKVNENTVQEMKLKKNLVSELDERSNDNPCGEQMDANFTKTGVPEMLDAAFDTQMAAEAMEALFHGEGIGGIANHDANDAHQGIEKYAKDPCRGSLVGTGSVIHSKKTSCRKRVSLSDIGVASQKKSKSMSAKLSKELSISLEKHFDNVRKQSGTELARTNSRGNSIAEESHTANGVSFPGTCTPVAHRTRQSLSVNQVKKAENASGDHREETNSLMEVRTLVEKSNSSTAILPSKVLKEKSSMMGFNKSGEVNSTKTSQRKQLAPKLIANNNDSKIDALSHPRRRSHRNLSGQENGYDNLDGALQPSARPKYIGKSVSKRKRSRGDAESPFNSNMKRKTRSGNASIYGKSGDMDGKITSKDLIGAKVDKRFDRNTDASCPSYTGKPNARLEESPREKCKPSASACTTPTPVNCKTSENAASPVCMGDEYFKLSCKGNLSRLSLLKEIRSLSAAGPEPAAVSKDSRKRRDMSAVRVLYSHHLDEDIMKQQKKILARLGVSIASSITDATHFIADQFVRTRNMLEAIASGKPVVTHLWLESCGQASCFIDEKNYILRDAKKEKEFAFSMPLSLARASQHPLLKGRRVLITPNTKPGKEIISNLVKAVQGQAVERTGRSTLKEDYIPEDLLVLSCEEDYAICAPFLEKGAAVYSSELLLNGIVTQRLEYERHRLFADKVKRTRSTIWIRKDDNQFLPVTKHK